MTIVDDVKAYLASVGVPDTRYSLTVLTDVTDVELTMQAKKCSVTAETATGDDLLPLTEAICRRVQVNLAKRALPLGITEASGDAEGGRVFLPREDPEIRRLEAPYRRLVCG